MRKSGNKWKRKMLKQIYYELKELKERKIVRAQKCLFPQFCKEGLNEKDKTHKNWE